MEEKKRLLLVVDYQERLVPAVANQQEIVRKAQQMIESFKLFGLPIVVTEQYPKGLGHTVPQIKECLNVATPIFEKMTFSAYVPELQSQLVEQQITDVILIGMETHVCVYQTCKDLRQAGVAVHVVRDAVGSRTLENAQNGLDLMRDCGASITNAETIIYEILGRAGTETFKRILQIVK